MSDESDSSSNSGKPTRGAKGLIVPRAEYEAHEVALEAAGCRFEPHAGGETGYLHFPEGTKLWSCPYVVFPGGLEMVLAIRPQPKPRKILLPGSPAGLDGGPAD